MDNKSEVVKQAIRDLIHQAYDKISAKKDMNRFSSHTYCVLMNFRLHKVAEEENLFTPKKDWYNPECRDKLLMRIKTFLFKHIK